jgi:hypothetical protein
MKSDRVDPGYSTQAMVGMEPEPFPEMAGTRQARDGAPGEHPP